MKNKTLKTSYAVLLNRVKKTLVEGQARVDAERVHIYWETGQLIYAHVLQYQNRAERNKEVVVNLSRDLGVSETVLHRCVKFAQKYPRFPKVAGRPLMSWTHYRGLITVADDKVRSRLEDLAGRSDWSADELALRIKEGKPSEGRSGVLAAGGKLTDADKYKPLNPLRGTPYMYRLVERPTLSAGAESGLLVDLGFGVYHEVEPRLLSSFSKDEIVESRPLPAGRQGKDDAYKFYKVDRTAKDLFTYAAYVEKVIDGDTIKVRLDLGFNVWNRQTLRLRDIDCPEVGTPAGDEARDFVRSHLKEAQLITVRSSRSDKYDRYLADIYIRQDGEPNLETDIYLNNLLLETHRAVRAG